MLYLNHQLHSSVMHTSYAVVSNNIPWNVPRVAGFLSIYTRLQRMCMEKPSQRDSERAVKYKSRNK